MLTKNGFFRVRSLIEKFISSGSTSLVKGISFHLNFGLPIFTLTVTSSIFSHAIVLSRVLKFIFSLFVSFIKKFATQREPFPQASISLPSELKNLIIGSLLSCDFLIMIS